MASSTRQARIVAQSALDALSNVNSATATELFAAANALHSSKQLRAALSDPSAEAASKEQLVRKVFESKLSNDVVSVLITVARARWSSPRDMADSMESLGVRASGEQQQTLVARLLSGKVSEAAEVLAVQAVFSKTYKRFAEVLEQYGFWIAEFAGESVAHIRVAKELSSAQLERLTKALAGYFGRELQINVEVDPEIIGGVHIAINGEVLDATVLTKLQNARLQLG
jgi:F-type H+-transporting ATPase subunit delta